MKISNKALVPALVLALSASACDLDLSGINENPNAPEDVPASSILPEAITSAASLGLGYNLNLDLTELWVQHVAEIQYAEEDKYELRSTEVDNSWRGFYAGPLADFQMIVDKGVEEGEPNVQAVGEIMQVWTWLIMTDVWGDLPYFGALAGLSGEEAAMQPTYDPQEGIYTDLLARLEAVVGLIDQSAGCPSDFQAADLIYECDMSKWERFANSLRLRMGMRLSEVAPSIAQQHVQAAVAGGVFNSNSDNAALQYLTASPNQNIWFEAIDPSVGGRPGDFRVSATLIGRLEALDDPRLPVYANPAAEDGEYRGMPNGIEEHTFQLSETSTLGESVAAVDAPAVFMSYAEVAFLLAEAAQRNWITGDAAEWWREGIEASMSMWGIADTEIQAYLAQPEVQYDAANWQQSIGVQKWLALYGNGPEAWAEWRRLGYPTLEPGADAVITMVPVRYPYPDSEFIYNEDNVLAAISASGGDDLVDGVWWDVD